MFVAAVGQIQLSASLLLTQPTPKHQSSYLRSWFLHQTHPDSSIQAGKEGGMQWVSDAGYVPAVGLPLGSLMGQEEKAQSEFLPAHFPAQMGITRTHSFPRLQNLLWHVDLLRQPQEAIHIVF